VLLPGFQRRHFQIWVRVKYDGVPEHHVCKDDLSFTPLMMSSYSSAKDTNIDWLLSPSLANSSAKERHVDGLIARVLLVLRKVSVCVTVRSLLGEIHCSAVHVPLILAEAHVEACLALEDLHRVSGSSAVPQVLVHWRLIQLLLDALALVFVSGPVVDVLDDLNSFNVGIRT